MKAKTLIAAVSLLTAAGSVLADNIYPYVDHSNFVSTKTRAEVVAELNQAAAKGQVARNSEFVEHTNVASTKTRAEVRAELESDYADGYYANNRSPEFVEHTNVASSKTREQVRSEAIQAAKSKQIKDTNFGG